MEGICELSPFLEWQAHQFHGDHRRHWSGKIVDEIHFAALDHAVEQRGCKLARVGPESLNRLGRELAIDEAAQRIPFGSVCFHRQSAGDRGERNGYPARPRAGRRVKCLFAGKQLGVARHADHSLVAGCDPVSAMVAGPGDRTAFAHLRELFWPGLRVSGRLVVKIYWTCFSSCRAFHVPLHIICSIIR